MYSAVKNKKAKKCDLTRTIRNRFIRMNYLKVFSFGHPNVETVINRYLSQIPPQNNGIMQFIEAYRNAKVRKLNALQTRMKDALDIEKNHWNELSRL
ncbi:MADS box protein, putative [Medicago truncatula]|uniref:MADS box protein, putative n=1 Tax=Medicago truncatula TaxID=3880 RepID=A0A072V951_MEDTR|nr:MADS box protein, putative [Medicago truncatula]